jgi:hypothetical protein
MALSSLYAFPDQQKVDDSASDGLAVEARR